MILRTWGAAVLRPYKIVLRLGGRARRAVPLRSRGTLRRGKRLRAKSALEAEPRDEGYAAGCAGGSHLTELKRIHNGIDRCVVDEVEDIRGLNAKLEGARFFDCDRFAQRHIHHELSRAFDDVTTSVAKCSAIGIQASVRRARRCRWRAKRGGVEPFRGRRIRERDRRARDVGTQRAADAAIDVE